MSSSQSTSQPSNPSTSATVVDVVLQALQDLRNHPTWANVQKESEREYTRWDNGCGINVFGIQNVNGVNPTDVLLLKVRYSTYSATPRALYMSIREVNNQVLKLYMVAYPVRFPRGERNCFGVGALIPTYLFDEKDPRVFFGVKNTEKVMPSGTLAKYLITHYTMPGSEVLREASAVMDHYADALNLNRMMWRFHFKHPTMFLRGYAPKDDEIRVPDDNTRI